jgi:hypothetical protein
MCEYACVCVCNVCVCVGVCVCLCVCMLCVCVCVCVCFYLSEQTGELRTQRCCCLQVFAHLGLLEGLGNPMTFLLGLALLLRLLLCCCAGNSPGKQCQKKRVCILL